MSTMVVKQKQPHIRVRYAARDVVSAMIGRVPYAEKLTYSVSTGAMLLALAGPGPLTRRAVIR